ncbi:MAG: alanine--tRNA ligase [Cytophagaceae bacterium]|nr:alanine--tRNA ligase [Gemmatimonadaceae bacterium]
MRASEIRSRFLDYFRRQQHAVLPSSSLVPGEDPTLLFTNAGMVQFKKVFLGLDNPATGRRATTSQKCVRAGGKHNDLEQVGHTARHHTFFEMLGNFSFGDYFKRDAIRFAWEWVTGPQSEGNLGIDPQHVRVSVFREDDEARALWREVTGIPDSRIYGLDEKDNFWQMADTGPCGPCSEIYVDLAKLAKDWAFPAGATGEWTDLDREEFSTEAFVEGGEAGRFLEIWNLVFMQFDRQADGTLVPLPKPSVDTGAGLERIAAVLQGVTNNYHTDCFAPLLEAIERVVGRPYAPKDANGRWVLDEHSASYRVLGDHARAVAFLLADGVFPSNEGRGYVLRRILRRAVRHAYLLGRREPTLVHVVQAVIEMMADVFPELRQRQSHLLETTRAEEERFLATIEGGMRRFEELAPAHTTHGSTAIRGTVSGEDAFKLYDTFGFPIDLTELMARERGYTVDIAGFEVALGAQRTMSQADRKSRKLGVDADAARAWEWDTADGRRQMEEHSTPAFVGYGAVEIESQVTAVRTLEDGRVAVMLRETPFYAESGGQVSDHGEIVGEKWRVDVEDVRKFDGRTAAIGKLTGTVAFGPALARVPTDRRRDTERNHTATHLLHAALRAALGDHVHQAGSLVAPDRLRFDFTHHGPIKPDILAGIEDQVNRGIWAAVDVRTDEKPYQEAVASGAMALFGEKYGDVVRVVSIPGLSVELCGGTHVRNTGQISLFKILSETGVAAGVRRIEAVTGRGAFEIMREHERTLERVGELVKANPAMVVKKVQGLVEEKRALEKKLEEALRGGGDQVRGWIAGATVVEGIRLIAQSIAVDDVRTLQALGDALREQMGTGVAALGATLADGKATLLVVSTDDARDRGARADAVVKELAAAAGGRGGGKPHMAQAGIPDPARLGDGLAILEKVVRTLVGA